MFLLVSSFFTLAAALWSSFLNVTIFISVIFVLLLDFNTLVFPYSLSPSVKTNLFLEISACSALQNSLSYSQKASYFFLFLSFRFSLSVEASEARRFQYEN